MPLPEVGTVHFAKVRSIKPFGAFVALEGVIRVEGIKDLTREELDARGLDQFFSIKAIKISFKKIT